MKGEVRNRGREEEEEETKTDVDGNYDDKEKRYEDMKIKSPVDGGWRAGGRARNEKKGGNIKKKRVKEK